MKKLFTLSLLIALGFALSGCTSQPDIGGKNHNTQEDFSEGISVDGTERISGTGAFYPLTDSVGTSSVLGTLNVGNTGTTTINLGKTCFKMNGAAGTVLYMFVNAAGQLATSTSVCY